MSLSIPNPDPKIDLLQENFGENQGDTRYRMAARDKRSPLWRGLALAVAFGSPVVAFTPLCSAGNRLAVRSAHQRRSTAHSSLSCQLQDDDANFQGGMPARLESSFPTLDARPILGGDGGKNMARATMLAVAAMYGTNFGAVKILEEAMPASVAAALRFAMASIVLLPLLKGMSAKVVRPSVEIGLLTAGGYYAQGISLTSGGTDASTAAFLCSLAVVVCPLLDLIQGSRKLGRSEVVAITLAILGTAVLELTGSEPGTGDMWAMVQPLAFGTAFWKVEQLMHKFPSQANAITALQVGTVGIFSVIWALLDTSSGGAGLAGINAAASSVVDVLHTDVRLVPALIWTALFTTALTVWLETKALGKLSSSETTLLFSTEPLWGAAFAHAALGEHLGPNTFVGGALILAACTAGSAAPPNPPTTHASAAAATTGCRSNDVTELNNASALQVLPSAVWLTPDVRKWQKTLWLQLRRRKKALDIQPMSSALLVALAEANLLNGLIAVDEIADEFNTFL